MVGAFPERTVIGQHDRSSVLKVSAPSFDAAVCTAIEQTGWGERDRVGLLECIKNENKGDEDI